MGFPLMHSIHDYYAPPSSPPLFLIELLAHGRFKVDRKPHITEIGLRICLKETGALGLVSFAINPAGNDWIRTDIIVLKPLQPTTLYP